MERPDAPATPIPREEIDVVVVPLDDHRSALRRMIDFVLRRTPILYYANASYMPDTAFGRTAKEAEEVLWRAYEANPPMRSTLRSSDDSSPARLISEGDERPIPSFEPEGDDE